MNASARADALEGGEGDEPVARPDVEHGFTRGDAGVGDDPVADRGKRGQQAAQHRRVAAVAAVQRPVGPLVLPRLGEGGPGQRSAPLRADPAGAGDG
jgi:hypothetical protein